MAKWLDNKGKAWTPAQIQELKQLAQQNTPTRAPVIGVKTGRTEAAVKTKASNIGLSLKPTNQSPYGSKKKPSLLLKNTMPFFQKRYAQGQLIDGFLRNNGGVSSEAIKAAQKWLKEHIMISDKNYAELFSSVAQWNVSKRWGAK